MKPIRLWARCGRNRIFRGVLSSLLCASFVSTAAEFEGRETHAIEQTPDGTRLLAVNHREGTLSVFSVEGPRRDAPQLIAEIPVGLGPVSVRAVDNREAWVVNELSDAITVVDLVERRTLDLLPCPDEPADIIFASGRAFVSCLRSNSLRVFDLVTRKFVGEIVLEGLAPQSLAVSPDGSTVYVAFLHSGNQTTILPADQAPPPPEPTNPNLPPAPQTSLIVPADAPGITYETIDHDVAVIDVENLEVANYLSGAGTNLLGLDVDQTGGLWVANTEAHNLIRFEPELRGRFLSNRITAYPATDGVAVSAPWILDLDDYAPKRSRSLAQPYALAIEPNGRGIWVAAFGSDRVARINRAGIETLIQLRPLNEDARTMRGPRALALDASRNRLYVYNKLAASICVIDTEAGALLGETPLSSHTSALSPLNPGRGFLFDGRNSKNGNLSCASCHLDAERDGIAWDLGNPNGEMQVVMGANLSVHSTTPRERILHPMKGPMTTQTLWGLEGGAPFHWRGDRATLADFNPTFADLLGGQELSSENMDALSAYLLSLNHHPNPNRTLANTLPTTLGDGDPARGRHLFNLHNNHCGVCHAGPRGSDNNLDLPREVGAFQPVKNPPLRTVYQRAHFDPRTGERSLTGFGMGKDGSLFSLPIGHPYILHELFTRADFRDVTAFVLSFDTGTVPAVGAARWFNQERLASEHLADVATLENQATIGACDLVAHVFRSGGAFAYLFDPPTGLYIPDDPTKPDLTREELLTASLESAGLLLRGTPPGAGLRYSIDRNSDGIRDRHPPFPRIEVRRQANSIAWQWSADMTSWIAETAESLKGPWSPIDEPPSTNLAPSALETLPRQRFFRLRRIW